MLAKWKIQHNWTNENDEGGMRKRNKILEKIFSRWIFRCRSYACIWYFVVWKKYTIHFKLGLAKKKKNNKEWWTRRSSLCILFSYSVFSEAFLRNIIRARAPEHESNERNSKKKIYFRFQNEKDKCISVFNNNETMWYACAGNLHTIYSHLIQ